MTDKLTHFDADGQAHMVDVSLKQVTARTATAKGAIEMQPDTLEVVRSGTAKKGDVLGIARIAGIMAAKKTHELIPLCHPLALSKVTIDLVPADHPARVEITATVKTSGQTGVEMEALTAVSVAQLTVYDMLKAIDKGMVLTGTRLVFKDGGKSGRFVAT